MKTNKQNKTNSKNSSELKNRTEQFTRDKSELSENTPATANATAKQSDVPTGRENSNTATQDAPVKPYVNFAERDYNRTLSVEKVLEKLKRWFPAQYELAEVVGKWVWITFPEQPAERVRADLSQLGFHWNNPRKCWQHPCGETLPRGTQEPREKYEVWFPNAAAKRREQMQAQAAAAA